MSSSSIGDYQARLKSVLEMDDARRQWHELKSLCSERPDFTRTLLLDRVIQRLSSGYKPELTTIKLAILSSSTTDHLLPAMRIAALARGLWLEVFKGDFGLYQQELMQPSPAIVTFDPDYILLSLSARNLLATTPVSASPGTIENHIACELRNLENLWRSARSLGAAVIQQSFLDISLPLFGNFDRQSPSSPVSVVQQLNSELLKSISAESTLLLDVATASQRKGIEHWFDINRWFQGKLEIAPQAAFDYGELVARLLCAEKGLSRKCLVFDLDNTLWGGVIGDDGMEGIVIGEGSAAGEAHLHLQRYAKQMSERGIVLAVCSKNEAATAKAPFTHHPDMALRLDDIAVFTANWNDKSANLVAIAEQLNLGLDSLVFVDDNPVERSRVRESLPMIAVPDLPADPAGYVACIVAGGYFDATSFTQEDRERGRDYAANARRSEMEAGAQSMDDFLATLNMAMEFGAVGELELSRAVQLINKTNQFNTTTRRYQLDEVARLIKTPSGDIMFFRLRDRFGDNGLVSVLLATRDSSKSSLIIDNWVMSCRVFGRQFEEEIMNVIVEHAAALSIEEIQAVFIPTERNAVINDLFSRLGFTEAEGGATETNWRLQVRDYSPRSTHIRREGCH